MLCFTLMFSREASFLAACGIGRSSSSQVDVKPFAEKSELHAFSLKLGRLDQSSKLSRFGCAAHHGFHRSAHLAQRLHHFSTPIADPSCGLLPGQLIEPISMGLGTFPKKLQHHIQPLLILLAQKLCGSLRVRVVLANFRPHLFRIHGFHTSCVAGKSLMRSI